MLEHIATSSVNVFEAGNPTMWGWLESHPFVVIWGWYGLVHDEVYHTYLYMCFHFFWSFHNFVMEMSVLQERISSRKTLRGLFATWPHGPMRPKSLFLHCSARRFTITPATIPRQEPCVCCVFSYLLTDSNRSAWGYGGFRTA